MFKLTDLRQQDRIQSKSYLPLDNLRSTEPLDDENILSSESWNASEIKLKLWSKSTAVKQTTQKRDKII